MHSELLAVSNKAASITQRVSNQMGIQRLDVFNSTFVCQVEAFLKFYSGKQRAQTVFLSTHPKVPASLEDAPC